VEDELERPFFSCTALRGGTGHKTMMAKRDEGQAATTTARDRERRDETRTPPPFNLFAFGHCTIIDDATSG